MAWFDDLDQGAEETKREYVARIKYDKLICEKADNLEKIISGRIKKGEQFRVVTNKSFNAIVAVEQITRLYKIKFLYIAVYRMNINSVNYIKKMTDQGIEINIILSVFFRENKKYERWTRDIKHLSYEKSNLKVEYSNSHAKVFLAKTKSGDHIVIEGSGNLSDNQRIEQYLIENNEMSFKFHKRWMDDILNG